MFEVREVLRLWLDGRSYRAIVGLVPSDGDRPDAESGPTRPVRGTPLPADRLAAGGPRGPARAVPGPKRTDARYIGEVTGLLNRVIGPVPTAAHGPEPVATTQSRRGSRPANPHPAPPNRHVTIPGPCGSHAKRGWSRERTFTRRLLTVTFRANVPHAPCRGRIVRARRVRTACGSFGGGRNGGTRTRRRPVGEIGARLRAGGVVARRRPARSPVLLCREMPRGGEPRWPLWCWGSSAMIGGRAVSATWEMARSRSSSRT